MESNYSSAASISLSAAKPSNSAESLLVYQYHGHNFIFCKAVLCNKRWWL